MRNKLTNKDVQMEKPQVTVNKGQDRVTIKTKHGQEFEILIDKDNLTIGAVTGPGAALKVTRLKGHTGIIRVRQK